MVLSQKVHSNEKAIKLGLVCSTGGHFYQMLQLKRWWGKYDRFWVTFDKPDAKSALREERLYFGYYPENRSLLNAIRNLLLAISILLKERPDIIFSSGAGVAPPFFLIGKILGIKLVYLETASYINIPTLTGRLVHAFTDVFLVQHHSSKKFYSKAKMKGALI